MPGVAVSMLILSFHVLSKGQGIHAVGGFVGFTFSMCRYCMALYIAPDVANAWVPKDIY